MAKNRLVNLGAQNKKSLADACAQDKGLPGSIMDNPPDVFCDDNGTRDDGWLTDISNKKVGIGEQRLCDPMQTGQIVNDVEKPNRNVVYRYSKALRGCDEAVMDLF